MVGWGLKQMHGVHRDCQPYGEGAELSLSPSGLERC
jgi:hypothetical protein